MKILYLLLHFSAFSGLAPSKTVSCPAGEHTLLLLFHPSQLRLQLSWFCLSNIFLIWGLQSGYFFDFKQPCAFCTKKCYFTWKLL